jgi:ABC-2 type transport system ATP-binding protein
MSTAAEQPSDGAATALVRFDDLTVSYGPLVALSGVSGEFTAGATGLLGPNGAGKTTFLKTLLGFLKPDRGRLNAFGLDPATAPLEVRRRIGYMPEVDCHLPGMTAATFVAFAGELSGMPRDEAVSRAHEVLYYVGLEEARYRTVDTYSTGMKQRVKLAQALVHDPDLLLLDEPTNGLDPDGREEMLALISDVSRRRQMSLILCSHLLRDVERVCERVIVFKQGEVAARGPIAELTGARRSVYDLRLKGDAAAFLTDLKDQGCDWREAEDGYRLFLADGIGPDTIFRTARACGVQVRYLRPGAESLEDVFLRALGHEG